MEVVKNNFTEQDQIKINNVTTIVGSIISGGYSNDPSEIIPMALSIYNKIQEAIINEKDSILTVVDDSENVA